MKKSYQGLGVMWLLGLGLSVSAQEPGFHLVGTESRPVPVTVSKMTNLVFPVAVAAGVKVSREVLVQKPTGIENVIELKAVSRNFTATNLSVYGVDGRLYSFDLHYVEDTTVLNYRVVSDEMPALPALGSSQDGGRVMLTGLPADMITLDSDAAVFAGKRGFFHQSVRSEGMSLRLKGLYLRDSLLWISLEMFNRAMICFKPAYLRVFVEDRKQVKRTASQEVAVPLIYSKGVSAVSGDSTRAVVLGLEPLTIARGKNLVIELADRGGGRHLLLRIRGRKLLRARVVLEKSKMDVTDHTH